MKTSISIRLGTFAFLILFPGLLYAQQYQTHFTPEEFKSSESGVYEYQLDAAARYIFQVNGARGEGYRSITASGVRNISDGHYYYNSDPLKDGDLVLMDYALTMDIIQVILAGCGP